MPSSKPISRSGRFKKGPSVEVQDYTQSVLFDWRLYRQDIAGSIAHATMLARRKLISNREKDQIVKGLRKIEEEIAKGTFRWKLELEDVHMNIEAELTSRVPAAAKLHTARSRNDQVATDMRLWVKDEIRGVDSKIRNLQKSLVQLAERTRISPKLYKGRPLLKNYTFIPIPGYTHLQRAQAVLAAHHLLAYVEMLERDRTRFLDCTRRADVCPLGSGAIAGTSLPVDRVLTAKQLGFREVSANSMDAVSDRDFLAEFTFAACLTGIHLSRLAEDLILWSSSEFGFVRIGDSHTTGSSLMPHKKNPDVAEIGRGKSGRLMGNLVGILTLLKGLPMTYNRDLQEDKPFLFDSAITLSSTLSVFASMLDNTEFNLDPCLKAVSDIHLLVTELADDLVTQGVPFRYAHHLVGEVVGYAEQHRKSIAMMTPKELESIHPRLKNSLKRLTLSEYFKSRDQLIGAPGIKQVETQLRNWKKKLA